jgi:hypothetical protein
MSGNGTWRHACAVHHFTSPFSLSRDEDGTIFISGLEIPTGDTSDDDDYWDDDDDDNGYYSSRKQAKPSDDLIDVDIDDYYGGEEGPDPDSQSGHAETALPYAGDNMKPAFSETGWTEARRLAAMSDDEFDRIVEVDTEEMIQFFIGYSAALPNVRNMSADKLQDWYHENYDRLADDYGLAVDPFTVDWEEVSSALSRTARRRRAQRKTAQRTEFYVVYTDGGDIVGPYEVGPDGGPEQWLYDDVISYYNGDAQEAAEGYGRVWFIEARAPYDDGREGSDELFGPDTNTVMTGLGVEASRRKRAVRKTAMRVEGNSMNAFDVAETLSAHEADAIMAAPFVARDYYSGQFSAMYALVSSGTMVEGLASEAREAAEIAEKQAVTMEEYGEAETLSILADVAERLGF